MSGRSSSGVRGKLGGGCAWKRGTTSTSTPARSLSALRKERGFRPERHAHQRRCRRWGIPWRVELRVLSKAECAAEGMSSAGSFLQRRSAVLQRRSAVLQRRSAVLQRRSAVLALMAAGSDAAPRIGRRARRLPTRRDRPEPPGRHALHRRGLCEPGPGRAVRLRPGRRRRAAPVGGELRHGRRRRAWARVRRGARRAAGSPSDLPVAIHVRWPRQLPGP